MPGTEEVPSMLAMSDGPPTATNDQGLSLGAPPSNPWHAKAKAIALLVGQDGATAQELESRAYRRVFRTYVEILNALAVADGWLLEYRVADGVGLWHRIEGPEEEPALDYGAT
jgi:hypothetical protein